MTERVTDAEELVFVEVQLMRSELLPIVAGMFKRCYPEIVEMMAEKGFEAPSLLATDLETFSQQWREGLKDLM